MHLRFRILLPLSVALLALASGALGAQTPVSPWLGERFIVPIPDTLENKNGGTRLTLASQRDLVMRAIVATDVTLSGPTGIVRTLQLEPGISQLVEVSTLYPPNMLVPIDPPGFRDFRAVTIVADNPIAASLRIINPFGSELLRLLPVGSWGRSYRLLSLRNSLLQSVGVDPSTKEEGFEFKDAPATAILIASEDSTRITLSDDVPTLGPRRFVLDAGELYRIPVEPPTTTLDTAARRLTGNLVTSDKPIGVISGNLRTNGTGHPDRIVEMPGNSPKNLLLEWLPPTDQLGQTFVAVPVAKIDGRSGGGWIDDDTIPARVRVVVVEDNTEIRTSFGGAPIRLDAGEWHDFVIGRPDMPQERRPYVITATHPVLVARITASEAIYHPATNVGPGYGDLEAWGPSMTLLDPVDEWIDVGFLRGFRMPSALEQRVVVVAEEGTLLSIDGRPIELAPVDGTPFLYGEAAVVPGDHTIRALGGRFMGIDVGLLSGYEQFAVPGTKERDDDQKNRRPQHVTEYEEVLSVSWSSPIVGGAIDTAPVPDSIVIDERVTCDSTVVTIDRVTENIWTLGPLDAALDAGATNVGVAIDTIAPLGPVVGYRVRLTPIDPTQDADGTLRVRGSGLDRTMPYRYLARSVSSPDELSVGTDLLAGAPHTATLTLENRRRFILSTLDVNPLDGSNGFTIDTSPLPRALRPGEQVELTVRFIGPVPSQTYRDTLVILTDCGVERVPVVATTSDETPVAPSPTITGYDWAIRPIGSTNDTLSFARNSGSRSYTIADVAIVGSGPFQLVPPADDGRPIANGATRELGIRFAPSIPGSYVDTIAMTTTDGARVTAVLVGQAVDTTMLPEIEVEYILVDTLCVDDTVSLPIVIRNTGQVPLELGDASVIRASNATLLGVLPEPRGVVIPVGEEFRGGLRILVNAVGPFEILVGFDVVGTSEGGLARFDGVGQPCALPAVEVDGHNFGAIWITTTRGGEVRARNSGRGPVTINTVTVVDDADGSFALAVPVAPFVLDEGATRPIAVDFTPPTEGSKVAAVLFATSIGEHRADIRGVGRRIIVPARIARDYTGKPGEEIRITVEIDDPDTTIYPGRIDWRVGYADDLLDPLGVVDSGGVTSPVHELGGLSGSVIRSDADSLRGGTLLTLRYLVRLSLLEETELPLQLSADRPWITFREDPGHFRRLGICALENRFFEFSRFDLTIGHPEPNPADDISRFPFSIPFENRTTVVLYDLLGNEVLRPLDLRLDAGAYEVDIPTALLPVGTYILRFRSGSFNETRRIDVVR